MSMNSITGTNNAWGSEYSLAAGAAYAAGSPQTSRGAVQLFLDASSMAAGDTYEIRFYRKINGTARAVTFPIAGAQSEPIVSLVFLMSEDWDVTLVCTAGTNTRAIAWSIARELSGLAEEVESGFTQQRYLKIIGATTSGPRDADGNFDSIGGVEDQVVGTAGDGTRAGITYGA